MSDIFSFDELDDLEINEKENYDYYSGLIDFAASPLCVPQDPLEDIELFSTFIDNKPISLRDLEWYNVNSEQRVPEKKHQHQNQLRVALKECSGGRGFIASQKQRSKQEGKRGWSMKEVSFCGEDGEESRRRCSHCETTETPQWRIGPLGPKTLCNACGVRYKSGRLLPEYRPAASPTFDGEKYSNFHRKILKKKGLM
ncbi:hypothetical protein Pint_27396 [Pistacia integerrima]|uniref:Uncharacterized protein n=1 Tax=Pistacia integerrima TaxID=434235 RepID=A0ACC0YPI9_9ROSI|nr:hypothetical protein Pint_27396 [Pistacia integerrima]